MVCCLDLSTTVEISPRAGLGVRFARLRTKRGVGGKNKPPSEREVSRFAETEGAYESIRFCVLPQSCFASQLPTREGAFALRP